MADLYPLFDDSTDIPTPQELATFLWEHFTEGEALDLLRIAGERWGWTWQLNMTSLLLLKPYAEAGKERWA
jgi:hypothetical protein